jgi:hypothetical protein
MRWATLAILFCLPVAATLRADDAVRRAEVSAATADARESLRHDVLATPIQHDLTVGNLVDQIGGAAALRSALVSAEQVDGTRWLDDQTVQVQLEIEGDAVAAAILKIAAQQPGDLPIPLPALREQLKQWKSRSFTATGTSTVQSAAEQLCPAASQQAWVGVSEQDRRSAIAAARRDAETRLLDSIRPITMPDGKALGDALEEAPVSAEVTAWLDSRPITSIEFRDDLVVRLSLSVDPQEFWLVMRQALAHQSAVSLPPGEAAWALLADQVEKRLAAPAGQSVIPAQGPATRAAVNLPAEPPIWAQSTLDAEGISRSVGPLLHTARRAEAIADERLAEQIDHLPLTANLTVGEASRRDPRIAESVARALGRARPFKVDYNYPEAGAVRVKVTVDLGDLWQELTAP